METFFLFLDESRCYRQKRDLTADFRFNVRNLGGWPRGKGDRVSIPKGAQVPKGAQAGETCNFPRWSPTRVSRVGDIKPGDNLGCLRPSC